MKLSSVLALSVTGMFAAACGSEFGSETPKGAAGMTAGGTGGVNVGGSGGASEGGSTSGGSAGTQAGGAAGVVNMGGGGTTGGSGGGSGDGGAAGGTPDASTGGQGGAPTEDGGKDAAVCLECAAFEKSTCCACIPNECPINYDMCRCHPDCAAYIGCRVQCSGSTTCIAGCKTAYPGGMAMGDAFLYCSDQSGCACN